MTTRKSIFHRLFVRAKWMARWFWRSGFGRKVSNLKQAPSRLMRWWSIYRLRLSWGRFFVECGSIICLLGLAALSFLFISHCVFQSVQVQGFSMYPTLLNTDIYWLNRFAYELHDPRPGDIVAIKDPSGVGFDVKRVIAIPTQSLFIRDGKVYVDGKVLRESYLSPLVHTYAYERKPDELVVLAPEQFFVMGDNRGNSCDSRTFGPIERQAILGRVIR
jgi:signal peptidase I